jgi:hypothetical protein
MGWTAGWKGLYSWQVWYIFPLPAVSRTVLGTTRPPNKLVSRVKRPQPSAVYSLLPTAEANMCYPTYLHLFMYCSLCNDTLSESDRIVSNEWMVMNKELEWMWKKAVLAWLKLVLRPSCGITEENQEKAQDSRCLERGSNLEPLEYLSEALPLEPACPVTTS